MLCQEVEYLSCGAVYAVCNKLEEMTLYVVGGFGGLGGEGGVGGDGGHRVTSSRPHNDGIGGRGCSLLSSLVLVRDRPLLYHVIAGGRGI